jgi:radical SAM superfamily enzyme YgiQ (UPF0313 family)
MRKILLLNPPGNVFFIRDIYCSYSSKANYYWPPTDLLVLSGILSTEHQVQVLDANVLGLSPEQAYSKIMETDVDTLVFVTGTASLRADLGFVRRIKEKKGVLTIASGGVLLFEGQRIMEANPFLDAILLDFSSNDILAYLNKPDGIIPNLIYREGNQLQVGERKWGKGPFSYPLPRHELFPLKKYSSSHVRRFPFTRVMTALGCPHRCAFCIGYSLGYKLRDMENIIQELQYVTSLGIREIIFADLNFIVSKSRTMELCDRLIENKVNISWSCNARVNSFDEKLLQKMKQAGCHGLKIGVESANDHILKRYHKGFGLQEIRDGFVLCQKHKIRPLGYFIIGLPGETEASTLNTIQLAKELDCAFASFAIATPDYGTPLRDEAIKNGWLTRTNEDFNNSIDAILNTEMLATENVIRLRKQAVKEFYARPGYMLKSLLGTPSFHSLMAQIKDGLSLFKKARDSNRQ